MQYDTHCIFIVHSSELDIWPVILFQTNMMMLKFYVCWWSNQFSWSVTFICQFLEDKLVKITDGKLDFQMETRHSQYLHLCILLDKSSPKEYIPQDTKRHNNTLILWSFFWGLLHPWIHEQFHEMHEKCIFVNIVLCVSRVAKAHLVTSEYCPTVICVLDSDVRIYILFTYCVTLVPMGVLHCIP